MRRLMVLCLLFFMVIFVSADTLDFHIEWQKKDYGLIQTNGFHSGGEFFDGRQMPNGDYIFFGSAVGMHPPDTSYRDWYFAVKTDSKGNLIWQKEELIKGRNYGRAVELAEDGSFVVGGQTSDGINSYGFIAKLDSLGNKVWEHVYKRKYDKRLAINSIRKAQSSVGGYYFAGAGVLVDNSKLSNFSDYVLVGRISENGDPVWSAEDEMSSGTIGSVCGKCVDSFTDSTGAPRVRYGGASVFTDIEDNGFGLNLGGHWKTTRSGRESKNLITKFATLPNGSVAIAGEWEQLDSYTNFGNIYCTDPWLMIHKPFTMGGIESGYFTITLNANTFTSDSRESVYNLAVLNDSLLVVVGSFNDDEIAVVNFINGRQYFYASTYPALPIINAVVPSQDGGFTVLGKTKHLQATAIHFAPGVSSIKHGVSTFGSAGIKIIRVSDLLFFGNAKRLFVRADVVSVNGRVLKSVSKENLKKVSIKDLSKGVYFLKLTDKKLNIFTEKFVK